MGEFRISHVRITFWSARWRDKKAGTRVVGWSPDFFSWLEIGGGTSTHLLLPHTSLGDWGYPTTSHRPTLQHPISPHIDEDALEGVYFAFSTILMCLPYFFRKTRPRASYGLLEAFLPSCPAERGELGELGRNSTRASGSLES